MKLALLILKEQSQKCHWIYSNSESNLTQDWRSRCEVQENGLLAWCTIIGGFDIWDRKLANKHKAASLWVMLNCLLLSSKWISITACPNKEGFDSLSVSPIIKHIPIMFNLLSFQYGHAPSAYTPPAPSQKSVPLTAPIGSHPVYILSLSPWWVPILLLYLSLFLFSKAHQDPGLWEEQQIPAKAATLQQPQ